MFDDPLRLVAYSAYVALLLSVLRFVVRKAFSQEMGARQQQIMVIGLVVLGVGLKIYLNLTRAILIATAIALLWFVVEWTQKKLGKEKGT